MPDVEIACIFVWSPFLLGEMAPHTFTAGQIYFPAGTPDLADVFNGRVDLEASVRRELLEETGMEADETAMAAGWTLVFAPQRIACMKLMTLSITAASAKELIDAHLARDPHAEFTRMHVVRNPREVDGSRVPSSSRRTCATRSLASLSAGESDVILRLAKA